MRTIGDRKACGSKARGLRIFRVATIIIAGPNLVGCNTVSNALNPYYETPPPSAYLGELNDRALYGEVDKAERARSALEQMATYQRAHTPQPTNPVLQPAVVRLLWIPDHVNKSGDLVPAHYYYLKVLSDRWAVKDAFELEAQLSPGGNAAGIASMPYVKAK